ncbi:GNAT family N-acetyltransferase [Lichenicola sp.]|uniref:GNAT family N-acetyltransferase n=1 Tax=Lichenicola sp. TaxID=2804529 RepID=UPI003B00BD6F
MTIEQGIRYAREPFLDTAEFKRVLIESGLGATRPVDDDERLGAMLAGSNLVLTARADRPDRRLLGLARCVTDFAWCCYLAELAVSTSAQSLGIGLGLLEEARRQIGPGVSLILASVPEAVGFYERAGMARVPDAFWFRRQH